MPFPLRIGALVVPHPAGLGVLVGADLEAGGGTVVAGEAPIDWVPDLDLGDDERRGLARGLLASGHPDGIALAVELGDPAIGPYFLGALLEHPLGTLMRPDSHGRSVEELLARGAARHAPLEDPRWRGLALQALRGAGAVDAEARVLARWGTAEELDEWGPGLLASGVAEVREAFGAQVDRDGVGSRIAALLEAAG